MFSGVAVDDAGRIKVIEFKRFYLGLGGWKRTRAFQESRLEDPFNIKLQRFQGFPAVVYPEVIADDPATCGHIVTDANARNKINTEGTIIDRLVRLKEISGKSCFSAQRFGQLFYVFEIWVLVSWLG